MQIDGIRSRGRLPILVGGSHYYVQALLFQNSIVEVVEHNEAEAFPILQEPTEIILQKLHEVDPLMATRWHPKDRRKIQRSLEIWLRTGQPASEVYAEQLEKSLPRQCEAADKTAPLLPSASPEPVLRFDTLVFWVHASKAVLHSRLDSRVLEMVKEGLLEEIKCLDEFQLATKEAGEDIDKTRGIWVAIGYKEFEQYRAALNTKTADEKFLESLMRDAIARTQAATRRYSNHQIRWIRTKLLNATARSSASNKFFLLDGSDLSQWNKDVARSAVDLAEKFLCGEKLPEPNGLSEAAKEFLVPKGEDLSHTRELWFRRTCESCDVTAVTAKDWEKHVCSKRHRKMLAGISKRQGFESRPGLKPTDSFAPAHLTHLEVQDPLGGSEPENTPIEQKSFF
jgi:tRNA dimethylallyltransferase